MRSTARARRKALIVVASAMLGVLFCMRPTAQAAAPAKPNILFIAIDDLNDWVGPLKGHPQVKTPHMDRLAKIGTTFTNAHCQSPLCNPSRTSLMLSLRPSTTGVYGLAPWFRNLKEFRDRVSLPQHLAAHGYRTFSTGKIYHGGYGRKKQDKEFHVLGPGASGKPFPKERLVKNTPRPHKLVDWGVFPHNDEDKGDYICASWAVEQLEKLKDDKSGKPFFLSCGFFLPHVPCFATQKWFDLYPLATTKNPVILRGDRDDTPRFSWYLHWQLPEVRRKWLEDNDQWLNLTRSYLATISFVDAQLGRVLDALEKSGHKDNTIIVLWSDHGWHIGEKGITGKNTLWDDGTRVPLIFAGPGIAKNASTGQPAELLDIYPTLVELCGLKKRTDLEGISLMPQLQNAGAKRDRPAITTHNHDNHGVRSEHWRYITYADGSEELYDHRNDEHEWHNLAATPEGRKKHAKVIAEHRKWLPKSSRKPAPGSRARILTYIDGKIVWEGKPVGPKQPIPELGKQQPKAKYIAD